MTLNRGKRLLLINILAWYSLAIIANASPTSAAPIAPVIAHPVFMCGSGLPETLQKERPSFESIASRPMALSADGSMLFVVNTMANCLEIFDVHDNKIHLSSTVSVGVDPVAVELRNDTEAWVVNHISDSVSVVDIHGTPHVKETLQVGDEPWDIVFADNKKTKTIKKPTTGIVRLFLLPIVDNLTLNIKKNISIEIDLTQLVEKQGS